MSPRILGSMYTLPKEIKEKLAKKIKNILRDNLISIVLFGSTGRNRRTMMSDVDLLVVSKHVTKNVEKEINKLKIEYLFKGIKIDVILISVEDALANFTKPSPLFASLVLGFEILYDTGFFKEHFKKMVEIIKNSKIVYGEGGKIWDLARIVSETLQ